MRIPLLQIILGFCLAASQARSEDWPQYHHDANRSNVSQETLVFPLSNHWTYAAAQKNDPAWPEPGKELHRIDFDYAPQPIVADGRVYVNSTADDSVRCLKLDSGEILWRFTAGAPVRFAPAYSNGHVFVASDDGWLYCLDAASGNITWKFQAAPSDEQLIGNERMISRWPLRSGVLVEDGVVHVVAGMWPDEGVFVYALDEKTGTILWRNDSSGSLYIGLPHPKSSGFSGVTPQGYLAANKDFLVLPTGRGIPAAFHRKDGELAYYTPGLGSIKRSGGSWTLLYQDMFFNPTHDNPHGKPTKYGDVLPVKSDGIGAYGLQAGKPLFNVPFATEVLANNDQLFVAGGENLSACRLADLRGKKPLPQSTIWSVAHPRIYSMALAGSALIVGSAEIIEAFDAATGKPLWKEAVPGEVRGLAIAQGQIVATNQAGQVFCFAPQTATPKTVEDPKNDLPVPADMVQLAKQIVEKSGKNEGYALVVGESAPAVALALLNNSKLHVIQPNGNEEHAAAERKSAIDARIYGSRLAVPVIKNADRLPFAPYFADLIVVAGKTESLSGKEIYRCLRPCGGALCFIGADSAVIDAMLKDANVNPGDKTIADGSPVRLVRGELPGAGTWRAEKADAGNTAVSAESRLKMPLELLWFGGPGPDRMLDRHYRANAPLCINGRMFITGIDDLVCVDAYNGREIWNKHMPGLVPTVTDKNCGNAVADESSIYTVIGTQCFRVDQATGKTLFTYNIPAEVAAQPGAWGYVEVIDGKIIGSVMDKPWERQSDLTCSQLFALDLKDGSLKWKYQPEGPVSLVSLTIGDKRLYLKVVSDATGQAKRRGEASKNALFAIDVTNGKFIWRNDDPAPVRPTLQYAQGLLVTDCNAAYDGATGKELWRVKNNPLRLPVLQGDWAIGFPYAFNIKTGAQKMMMNPLTGEESPWKVIRAHGCGSLSGCLSMLFFRSGSMGFFDSENQASTNFGGVRPSCGISMIAAAGLALMPEASSGCGCAYSYQTSLALAPAEDRQRDKWFVVPGEEGNQPFKNLNVLLGAPGDRKDDKGNMWVSYPRPILAGALPISLSVSTNSAQYYHAKQDDQIPADQAPWMYANGLLNPGKITIDLSPMNAIRVPVTAAPLVIDGQMDAGLDQNPAGTRTFALNLSKKVEPAPADDAADDEAAAKPKKPAAKGPDLKRFKSILTLRSDKNTLYVVMQSPSPKATLGTQWAAVTQGNDAQVWTDDSCIVYLTDRSKSTVAELGVSASGARFDGLWKKGAKAIDASWNADWKSQAVANDQQMIAEMAIPLAVISQAGINTSELMMNAECVDAGWTSGLVPQNELRGGPCKAFIGLINEASTASNPSKYTVRLRFAETEGVPTGQRVFDVKLQDQPVLTSFDICKEAGGANKPLVKEFTGIAAPNQQISVELIPSAANSKQPAGLPIINAIEVAAAE